MFLLHDIKIINFVQLLQSSFLGLKMKISEKTHWTKIFFLSKFNKKKKNVKMSEKNHGLMYVVDFDEKLNIFGKHQNFWK